MSKLRRFIPKTRQQIERQFQVLQSTFIKGVYNDIPASAIPAVVKKGQVYPEGLYYLVNAIVYDHGIEGRQGNRVLNGTSQAALPSLATGVYASKTGYTITITGGTYTLTQADVGRYFDWGDPQRDVIVAVDTGTNKATVALSTAHSSTMTGKIVGDIKAWKWHDLARKWIMQIDTRIFVSDSWKISAWIQVAQNSKYSPSETKSMIKIYKDSTLLFNTRGIFKIDVYNTPTPVYYQVNSVVPPVFDAVIDSQGSLVYGRRYLYSYARLDTVRPTAQRIDDGVSVLHESGTNPQRQSGVSSVTADKTYIDWNQKWSADPISDSNGILTALEPPDDTLCGGRHFTHYCPQGTLDVGINGTDPSIGSGVNPERYWWMNDVPFVKAFTFTRDSGGGVTSAGTDVFSRYDTESDISYCVSGTTILTDTIQSVLDSNYALGSTAYSVLGTTPGCIGASSLMMATKSGTTVSRSGGSVGSRPTSDDIGKLLFWEDGTYDVITGISLGATASLDTITVAQSGTKTAMAVAWNPVPRNYYDYTSDDSLMVRNGFMLKQRFFSAMPNCNVGEVAPGFVFGAIEGDVRLYYCNTGCNKGDKSFVGYYHPGHQFDVCDQPLVCLSSFDGNLIGYQYNGFAKWDTKNTLTMDNTNAGSADIGEQPITVLVTRTEMTGIGILNKGSFVKTMDGTDIVLTNNRELRTHNGTAFSTSYSSDHIQKRLNKLQSVSAMHYDSVTGLLIYGTENSAITN